MATIFATLGASVAAVAALWFSGQSLKVSNDQQSLAQQTATTDRFRLAAEQLASDQLNVRLSGIYLLERLAKDSPGDHPTVFALLSSFLRTHAHNEACNAYFTEVPGVEPPGFDPATPLENLPTDVETALTVISRRDVTHDDPVNALDLRRACLPEAWAPAMDMPGSARPNLAGVNLTNAVLVRMFESRKPIIAAVNGPAVGVGITMTLAADFRLAADGARIGFVFNRRGIVPESCSSWFLPRLVPMQTALDWVYSGRLVDASEAREAGLFYALHPADTLLDEAYALARRVTEHSAPVSVALSRQMLWRNLGSGHPMIAHRVESRGI
nr:enoyl-CoA hydratase-related protein [Nocardia abscessus]